MDTRHKERLQTYRSILGSLRSSSLESGSVTLVLKTLRSNEPLDLGSLGVWLLPLALGLDLTTNNKLANLFVPYAVSRRS